MDYAFCVRKEFPVRAAGGQALVGDIPFTPEIKLDGTYYPVCGLHFGDNDEGASALCRLAGYTWGGKVIKTKEAYTKDAMPIGKCNPGEDIASCTAGGNAYGDLTHQEGMCTAGSPVGVQIACNEQVKDPDMWCIITNIFFCVRSEYSCFCYADATYSDARKVSNDRRLRLYVGLWPISEQHDRILPAKRRIRQTNSSS